MPMLQPRFAPAMAPRKIRKDKPQPRIVDARHRVALSADAMRLLGVEVGDYVIFDERDGEVVLRRVDWTVHQG